jgi:hypothetical protein
MTALRNIRRVSGGWQVRVYRRGRQALVTTCLSLKAAIARRDEHEARYPSGRPWSGTERKDRPRTTASIRDSRRKRGLCIMCGAERARLGRVTCGDCAMVAALKRK